MPEYPLITAGEYGADFQYAEDVIEDFNADGVGAGPHFVYGYGHAGNDDQAEDGSSDPGGYVQNKRWSAWYDGDGTLTDITNEFVYQSGGKLYVGGKWVNDDQIDPTRENFTFDAVAYDWNDNKFYAPFLVSYKRIFDNDLGYHVTDPASPGLTWGPGHFFELKVSFENMAMRGFRLSAWLMPAEPNYGNAYTADAATGCEIDIFEFENWDIGGYKAYEDFHCKVIAGAAGSTPGGAVDVSAQGLDTGFHTVGLLWLETGIYWYLNGVEIRRDETLIPLVEQYFLLTRELNAGVKPAGEAGPNEIPDNGILRPVDVGLYNVSAILDKELMPNDKAAIEYFRVWRVTDETPVEPPDPSPVPKRRDVGIDVQSRAAGGATFRAEALLPYGATIDDYSYQWTVGTGLTIIGPSTGASG